MPTEEVIKKGKFFAVLSYLSVLSLVSVAFGRRNGYAAFHVKQGLLLFVIEVAAIALGAVPEVGIYLLGTVWGILAVLSVIGVKNAFSGTFWRLPSYLGKWAAEIQL